MLQDFSCQNGTEDPIAKGQVVGLEIHGNPGEPPAFQGLDVMIETDDQALRSRVPPEAH